MNWTDIVKSATTPIEAIITIQAFMRGSKVRCGPERWNLMFWNLKRFIDKNGRVPCNGGCGGCKGCRR